MRHLRAVNDVLASLLGRPKYKPALRVASKIPGVKPGRFVAVQPRALTEDALENFIRSKRRRNWSTVSTPTFSPPSIKKRLSGKKDDVQAIRTVMAEGEDHYRTFLDIQEWLKPYLDDERKYLRAGPSDAAAAGQRSAQDAADALPHAPRHALHRL